MELFVIITADKALCVCCKQAETHLPHGNNHGDSNWQKEQHSHLDSWRRDNLLQHSPKTSATTEPEVLHTLQIHPTCT